MENRITRTLYNISPWIFKCAMSSVFGVIKNRARFSGDHGEWARLFQEAHGWSEEELYAFQSEKLCRQIRHAYDHVPYYRDLFRQLNLTPDDIRSPADLPKLPILEKTDIVREGDRLISDQYDRRRLVYHPTSGSTGTPLMVPWESTMDRMEWAFVWNRYRPGVTRKDPFASFTGLEIVRPSQKKPPFWIDNWASHQRMFSVFHMSDTNLSYYVDALERRYSKYYTGYSSAVYTIADFMLRKGLRLSRPPDVFFAASEEVQPIYAETIAKAFGCKIFQRCGQAELVGSVTQYECGHMHYDMDFSILEFLPVGTEDGLVLAEMIGTKLHDHAWPLIRYRTGDLVVYDCNDICPAGTPGQIIRRIHGRTGKYFSLPDGSRVTNISVIAKKCQNIRFMQVVQDQVGSITVKIVKDSAYTREDEREIIRQFRRKLGEALEINLEYVKEIPKSASGKYVSIVNNVEPDLIGARNSDIV